MTIKEILSRAAIECPDRTVLRFKEAGIWKTRSYGELQERTWRVSEICVNLGVKPGDRVALFLGNCPEWIEIYFGIVGIGAVAVPVDVKLREQEVRHIFHDCNVSLVFVTARNAAVIEELAGSVPSLKAAVLLDAGSEKMPPDGEIRYAAYEEIMEQVSDVASSVARAYDHFDPSPDDPASFIYTSGTTGRQKGAVLTHRNFTSNVQSCQQAINIHSTDNFLLVLPLHHSFAFTAVLLLPMYVQCEISMVENLRTVKVDMLATSPTVFMAVPLLLEKMLARTMEAVQKNRAAHLIYKAGFGRVIGKRINRDLGGKLRMLVSGGAPISPDVLRGWSRLGFPILEGYGITETGPVLSLNPPGNPRVGTVGLPIPEVEIKIIDPNPEGVGEIAAKGPNIMQGYHGNPEATAECLVDGWFYTGDLGHFDEAGYLVISGRKKSLIVNREGKNIYPEEVEQQMVRSPYILECLAVGYREPGENVGERVGLIAVPDQEAFDAQENEADRRFSEQEIDGFIRSEIKRLSQEIAEYKRPRCIQIRFDEFEKTTTTKVKRYLYAIDTGAL